MSALLEFFRQGGPVMLPLVVLSVILYSQCGSLFLLMYRTQRQLGGGLPPDGRTVARVRALREELQEAFQRQRFAVAAMITAAPLLGLLGTVTGMIGTFESLSRWGGQKSMEGLARGISEVLICTETGLAVAVPAILLLYYAHRQLQKGLQHLARHEGELLGGT